MGDSVVEVEEDDDDGIRVNVVGDDENEEGDCNGGLDGVDGGATVGTMVIIFVGGDDKGEEVNSGSILDSIEGEMDCPKPDVVIVVVVADDGRSVGCCEVNALFSSAPLPNNVNPILTTPSSSVISKHGVLPVAGLTALSTPGEVNNSTPPPPSTSSSPPTAAAAALPIQTGPKSNKFGNCALM